MIVLITNAVTGYLKGFIEDILPVSVLPFARRGYVVLPILVAAVLCVLHEGAIGWQTISCGMKYGVLASWVHTADRSGIQGR